MQAETLALLLRFFPEVQQMDLKILQSLYQYWPDRYATLCTLKRTHK